MDSPTLFDQTHAQMVAAPDSESARLKLYERLIDGEWFLLLSQPATDDTLDPHVFETEEGTFVLIFDREERLTAFMEGSAPYAALSGRSLVHLLSGQGIGLGINLEVAPSAMLLPDSAVAWMLEQLANQASEQEALPEEINAPAGLPETLLEALDLKLAGAAGLAELAYLVEAVYDTKSRNHLLVFVDAVDAAKPALVTSVNETLIFSGLEAGSLDVAFCKGSDEIAAKLARVGLRFDLPRPEIAEDREPTIPGMDPEKPPILR